LSKVIGVKLSQIDIPLKYAVSDAKVATGKQSPLSCVHILLAEILSDSGEVGIGFSYTLRVAAKASFELAKELAPYLIGRDNNEVQKIWIDLNWRTNSLGPGGLAAQVIASFDSALWDLKAKIANLSLAQLIGPFRNKVRVYNSGGQYLQATLEEIQTAAKQSIDRGIGGIKMKVGQPKWQNDIERIEAVRDIIGPEIDLMIDANQQWNRSEALEFCKRVDDLGLAFIEEPLNARDFKGHAILASQLKTPIATGEMLTSYDEHAALIECNGCAVNQVDAPRIGGVTPFLRVAELASTAQMKIAPHFVMEQHIQLAATCGTEGWVEHFDWLEPLFDERLVIEKGFMHCPDRPGFGLSISEYARTLTNDIAVFGASL